MSSKQKERRDGRIIAVQILYTSEVQGKKPLDLLDEGLCLIEDGPLSDFSLAAVRGVQDNQEKIDECLQSISENWTLSRMPMVDLAVLRLAAYEILFSGDVPVSVAINEAVELAKAFGGEDESPRFVNGVLGRLARKLEENPNFATEETVDQPTAEPSEQADLPAVSEAVSGVVADEVREAAAAEAPEAGADGNARAASTDAAEEEAPGASQPVC